MPRLQNFQLLRSIKVKVNLTSNTGSKEWGLVVTVDELLSLSLMLSLMLSLSLLS